MAGPAERTARLARGAKPQKPTPQTHQPGETSPDSATMKLPAGERPNGMWDRSAERRLHPRTGSTLRRVQNPTSVAGTKESRPGRDNSPIRKPGTRLPRKTIANDLRGRRFQNTQRTPRRREALKTAWASRPKAWVLRPDQRRSGMAWNMAIPGGTARPANAERNKRNLMRGGSPICMRSIAGGNRQPGDESDPRALC